MIEPFVHVAVVGPVVTLTLNRPSRLNALDEPMRLQFLEALVTAENDADVSAIILTGAGRGFCVGQDISAVDELEDCQDCVDRTYNPIVAQIVNGSTPVIAAVNGACVGAGMGIALACDMVFMAETAFMSCAFSQIALVPDSGASFFLVRALGYHRAFEIATTGRPIPAEECFSLGLTTRFVPPDELAEIANAHALAIANGAKEAIFLTRQLLRKGLSEPFEDILVAEAKAQGLAGRTAEHIDRRTAFLASRSSK